MCVLVELPPNGALCHAGAVSRKLLSIAEALSCTGCCLLLSLSPVDLFSPEGAISRRDIVSKLPSYLQQHYMSGPSLIQGHILISGID